MSSTFKRQAVILAFFALVAALALFWPLLHSGTHVPGSFTTDYFHFHWSYWWIRHALTNGLNVYETNYVHFPFTTNLSFHTLAPFWYPLWAVLEPGIGTLAAVNVIFWVALALTGYVTFLLLRREGAPLEIALVGGVILEVCPAMINPVFWTNLNLIGGFWLAGQVLLWRRVARSAAQNTQPQRTQRAQSPSFSSLASGLRPPVSSHLPLASLFWALVQGIALYAMIMTDLQYALFAAFLLIPYGLLTLWEARTWQVRVRLVALGALAVIVGGALAWFAGPLAGAFNYDVGQLATMEVLGAVSIPFPEGYMLRIDDYWFTYSVGGLIMALTFGSLAAHLHPAIRAQGRADKRRWFWFAVMLLPLILSAGPQITIAGIDIPLPYAAFHSVFGGVFRFPARLAMVFMIPALIFAGRTWRPILSIPSWRALRPWIGAGLLFLAFVDLRVLQPIPIQPPLTHYAFYERIGQEQGAPYDDEVIVEVPVAAGSGETNIGDFNATAFQFYGIDHGKRMINGHFSRAPVDHFWYLRTDDPMLSWLGQRRLLEPDAVRRQLEERIWNWPIGYIVVHQDAIGREGPTAQEIIGYFNQQDDLLCPVAVEGDAVFYRTAWHPDGCPPRTPPEVEPGVYQIDVGSPGDERYIGWGWHWPERVFDVTLRWTGQYPQTDLYVDLPPGGYRITLAAQSFWRERDLQLIVNGTPLETVTVLTDALAEYAFTVPTEVIGDGRHVTVRLAYDGTDTAADVGLSADQRPLAVAVDWVRFERR